MSMTLEGELNEGYKVTNDVVKAVVKYFRKKHEGEEGFEDFAEKMMSQDVRSRFWIVLLEKGFTSALNDDDREEVINNAAREFFELE